MLRTRMSWLDQRQNVLAQNVANSDTPAYVARDLRALDFDKALKGETSGGRLTITNARHIAVAPSQTGAFEDYQTPDQESTPDGNAVSLETEMIKVSDTQAQFQAAANIYAKTMSMMRTAIGH
jgi:flagellar basal-body rod protein FlgB